MFNSCLCILQINFWVKSPICGKTNLNYAWPVNFIQLFVISLHLHNICIETSKKYRKLIMTEVVFTFHRFCSRTMWRLPLSRAARVKPLQRLTPSLQVAGEVLVFHQIASTDVPCTIFEFTPQTPFKLNLKLMYLYALPRYRYFKFLKSARLISSIT